MKFRVHTRADIDRIPELQTLSESDRLAMKAVSAVLPFRVNRYVIENLIDWSRVPDAPIFQLMSRSRADLPFLLHLLLPLGAIRR